MTPGILLSCLRHSFIKMNMIKVLIMDECHHVTGDHPYACIMNVSLIVFTCFILTNLFFEHFILVLLCSGNWYLLLSDYMQEFYHQELRSGTTELPRIFGMTASLVKSKGIQARGNFYSFVAFSCLFICVSVIFFYV
jgi:endoribonuclease Dicer